MKICDICAKTVTRLDPGPPELESVEICEECSRDLLRRFAGGERRLAEMKRQMRDTAITEWKRERGAKGGAFSCLSSG
ncbi:MAG: hypothetical protein ABSH14_01540 [Verrucomicrobiia bacterium]|jgi:hypothetical protein